MPVSDRIFNQEVQKLYTQNDEKQEIRAYLRIPDCSAL
jgi:sortase (surface protein transpeptidase)